MKEWQFERSGDFWNRIINLHYNPKQWVESFHMSKENFLELCDLLKDEIKQKLQFLKPREPVSVEKQIAVALYKLASTAEYRVEI